MQNLKKISKGSCSTDGKLRFYILWRRVSLAIMVITLVVAVGATFMARQPVSSGEIHLAKVCNKSANICLILPDRAAPQVTHVSYLTQGTDGLA